MSGTALGWFADARVPLAGLAFAHANTTLYLRKRLSKSTFVANNVAEHVKFTACGMAVIEDAARIGSSDDAEISLSLPLTHDGSNDPLVVDTSSAIT